MTLRHRGSVIVAGLVGLVLQGCAASASPGYDSVFGDAARGLRSQQLIDPNAGKRNAAAVVKQDGRAAREAHDRYVETYTAPPQTTVINIGIGGGK
ncbi:hypothetical protein [Piscinibacter sp. XHJ-5]|uniref:hypothetical protein n=1 Tax=Piscinibacter sp. XHJ-5 TaxID=3037797 RepID=UPI0024535029|nr:hypothetical protein [Piscinibacter sp. XHJ-5]